MSKAGIKVFIGHSKKNIKNATILVRSSAIKNNNSEIKYLQKKKYQFIQEQKFLADVVSLKKISLLLALMAKQLPHH